MPHIPMSSPDITDAEIDAVVRVLRSGTLSIGPRLDEFEKSFAARVGREHAIAVSSGTSALHLCVIAAGLGDGDLVITSPFSFVASANCLLYERAVPIFADVDPATGNIDPADVLSVIDDLERGGESARQRLPRSMRDVPLKEGALKGLLPVHAFGQMADMTALMDIANRKGLRVIEDACEAIGATHQHRQAGSFAESAAFAFYPNKQMTTAEGGMVVTNDGEVADVCRSLRNQGRDVFDAWLTHSRLGYNYRLTELASALGVVQLSRLDELLAKRARVASWYAERLSDLEGISLPCVASWTTNVSWFVYVVRLASAEDRARVMHGLAQRDIPSRPYFSPIHLQPFFVKRFGYCRGDFPVTEALGDRSLALPFSAVMSEEQVDIVCEALADVLSARSIAS